MCLAADWSVYTQTGQPGTCEAAAEQVLHFLVSSSASAAGAAGQQAAVNHSACGWNSFSSSCLTTSFFVSPFFLVFVFQI